MNTPLYLEHPWMLFLLLPLLWYLWQDKAISAISKSIRLFILLTIFAGLSNPTCSNLSTQQDYVFIIDTSASMPKDSQGWITEWIQEFEGNLAESDRFAVVEVGREIHISKELDHRPFAGFQQPNHQTQSKLNQGIDLGLELLHASNKGKIILFSDGAPTDGEFQTLTSKAIARNVPIYSVQKQSNLTQDIRITRIDAPQHGNEGEQIPINIEIEAPLEKLVTVQISRDGTIIATGSKQLQAGRNSLQFTDAPEGGGVHTYAVDVIDSTDTILDNNHGEVGVLLQGRKKIAILTQAPSPISTILRRHGIDTVELDPSEHDLSLARLSQFEVVILHNIASTHFTAQELQNLQHFVDVMGHGLWMIGGANSFGVGGYLHTPLEEVLPVQLELRDKIRKMGMALGIALDRSGSMSVSVGPNLTKMDLANQGTAAAISMLNRMDSIYVAAVDTESHTVIPLQKVENIGSLVSTVLKIESTGGGIYVSAAMQNLLDELPKAPQKNKHIVLFADANDAVDNDNTLDIIDKLQALNISCSVIALGKPTDSDAPFLAEVARRGGGTLYFSENPKELPKLFAMDTMIASKSGYIEERTTTQSILGLSQIGGPIWSEFPEIEAYNVSYPKTDMHLGVQTVDEESSPLLVTGRFGLGQSVAYLGDIGGPNGQQIVQWAGFSEMILSIIQGISSPEFGSLPYVGITEETDGHSIVLESLTFPSDVQIIQEDGSVKRYTFEQLQPTVFQAKIPASEKGIQLSQLQTNEGLITLPPISTIADPEFSVLNPLKDKSRLTTLSQRTGGRYNATPAQILEDATLHIQYSTLQPLWTLLTALLMMIELAERKIRLLSSVLAYIRSNKIAFLDVKRNTQKVRQTIPSLETSEQGTTERTEGTSKKVEGTPVIEDNPHNSTDRPKAPSMQDALRRAKERK